MDEQTRAEIMRDFAFELPLNPFFRGPVKLLARWAR